MLQIIRLICLIKSVENEGWLFNQTCLWKGGKGVNKGNFLKISNHKQLFVKSKQRGKFISTLNYGINYDF